MMIMMKADWIITNHNHHNNQRSFSHNEQYTASNGDFAAVAFKRPGGKKVSIAVNDGAVAQSFNIKYKSKWVTTALDAGAVATYTW